MVLLAGIHIFQPFAYIPPRRRTSRFCFNMRSDVKLVARFPILCPAIIFHPAKTETVRICGREHDVKDAGHGVGTVGKSGVTHVKHKNQDAFPRLKGKYIRPRRVRVSAVVQQRQ